MKSKKVKAPTRTPGAFVLSATDLIGIDPETGILRLRDGLLTGAIKIKGIDMEGLKENDREAVYRAWGAAEQSCGLLHKIVLCDVRPDLSPQLEHIERLLQCTDHSYRRYLLERERGWLRFFQINQKDREGFILFFSKDAQEIRDAARRYTGHLLTSQVQSSFCDWNDCLVLMRILLQFEN